MISPMLEPLASIFESIEGLKKYSDISELDIAFLKLEMGKAYFRGFVEKRGIDSVIANVAMMAVCMIDEEADAMNES